MSDVRGHSKLFIRLFSMFLLVALVPTIVLGAFSAISAHRRMVTQLDADSERLLSWIKSNTDEVFLDMELDSVEIALDPDLRAVVSRTLTTSERILRLKDLQDTLRAKYHAGRGDAFVYFRGSDRVLSSTGFFERDYLDSRGLSPETLLDGADYPRVLRDGVPRFRLIRGVPLDAATPRAGLCLTVSLEAIESLLTTWAAHSDMELAVVDGSGTVLLCSLDEENAPARILGSYGEIETGGNRYAVRTAASDYRGWSYVSLIPRSALVRGAIDVASATVAISLSLILGGAILSYVLSRIIYNPIAGLYNLTRVRFSLGNEEIEAEDELRFLDRAIRDLISSSDNLTRLVEKSSYALKGEYFASLLAGVSTEDMEDRATALGIAFPFEAFVLVALELDRDDQAHVTDAFPVRRLIVARTSEQVTAGKDLHEAGLRHEAFYLGADRIGILVNGNEAESLQQRAVEVATRVSRKVERENGFTVSAGVGSAVSRLSHLGESLSAAEHALERKMHLGKNSVIASEPALRTDESVFVVPLIEMERIANLLKTGDVEPAAVELRRMFQQLRDHERMPIENVRYVLIQLLSVVSQGMMEAGVNLGTIFGADFDLFRELEHRKTLEDIEEWVVTLLCRIGAHRKISQPTRSDLVSRAVARVRAQYAQGISLSTIAEELGVSAEHLSRRFKEETGERYVEYVNRLRLEKARDLVSTTDWTLDIVAKESGFSNYQYLIRRYKRYFGVTPAQDRGARSS